MSQYVSTSVARVLERLVEENRELQARQSHGQALANVLSPYLGDITQLLNHPNSNFDAPVAAPASSPGVGGLQSGVAHSELERVIAVLTQEFLQQEAAERARQAMQQSQKDLAQHCIASLLVAAQMQQQQEQVTQQVAPTAAISDQVVTILESRQPVAEAKSLGVVSQVTHEEPPQSDMKNVPLKKRSTRKKDAAKPAKKKSVYLKSGLKKKAKIEEEPDALSYPCRCRGLPENHNARVRIILDHDIKTFSHLNSITSPASSVSFLLLLRLLSLPSRTGLYMARPCVAPTPFAAVAECDSATAVHVGVPWRNATFRLDTSTQKQNSR
jgi:hypothetical protein